MKTNMKSQKGFTLLEILLVIAAIGILAAIVIVAINPQRQLGQTRDAQRRADVQTISNAIYQYIIDGNALPSTITATATNIEESCTTPGADPVDLSALTADGEYLAAIPTEPSPDATDCYQVRSLDGGRIEVSAPAYEEADALIEVTR